MRSRPQKELGGVSDWTPRHEDWTLTRALAFQDEVLVNRPHALFANVDNNINHTSMWVSTN